jgi:hypothetical protein
MVSIYSTSLNASERGGSKQTTESSLEEPSYGNKGVQDLNLNALRTGLLSKPHEMNLMPHHMGRATKQHTFLCPSPPLLKLLRRSTTGPSTLHSP